MDVFSTLCSICCNKTNTLRNIRSYEEILTQFNIMLQTCCFGQTVGVYILYLILAMRQSHGTEEICLDSWQLVFFGVTVPCDCRIVVSNIKTNVLFQFFEDEIPVYLCDSCSEKLVSFNTFKEQFITNIVKLRNMYLNIRTQLEIEKDKTWMKHEFGIVKEELDNENDVDDDGIVKEETDLINDTKIEMENLAFHNIADDMSLSDNKDCSTSTNFEQVIIKEEEIDIDKNESEDSHFNEVENDISSSIPEPKVELSTNNITDYNQDDIEDDEEMTAGNEDISSWNVDSDNNEKEIKTKPAERVNLNLQTPDITISAINAPSRRISDNEEINQNRNELHYQGVTISYSEPIRIHGEKWHVCQVCGKRFRQSHDLTRHMRTHTNEKPYACQVCWKTFTQFGNVTRHMRTHTKEKPFPCKVCGRLFSDLSSVARHTARIHTKV